MVTTHSIEILEHLKDRLNEDTKVNYFNIVDDEVINSINPSVEYLKRKIKNEVSTAEKIQKIHFICEDESTQYFAKNLINGTELKKIIHIEKGPFPDGTLISMAESNHSIFKNVYFILDGDVKKKFVNKKVPPRTIFLPSNNRPETTLYEFVKSLSDKDKFWDDDKNFTKLTCFNGYTSEGKGTHKNWFTDLTNKRFFGTGYSTLLNRWKSSNKTEVNDFLEAIRNTINN